MSDAPTPSQVKAAVTAGRTLPGIYLDAVPVPYVRGVYGRTYDVSGGTKAVRKYLDQLGQMKALPTNEDYDLLLEALWIFMEREKATETKEATA